MVGVARLYAELARHAGDRRGRRRPRPPRSRPRACAAWSTPTIMSAPRARPRRWRRHRARRRADRPCMSRLEIFGIEGIGEIAPGDDLAGLIADGRRRRRHRPGRRRRRRRDPEDRVEGRGPARGRSTPTTRSATSRSSSASRCASCAAGAISSSARPSTASCAPTPASTCRTSSAGYAALLPEDCRPLGPPHPRRPPGARPASRSAVIVSRHLRAHVAAGRHRRGHRLRRASPPSLDLRGTTDSPRPRDAGHRGGAWSTRSPRAAELVMGKATGVPVAVVRGRRTRRGFGDGSVQRRDRRATPDDRETSSAGWPRHARRAFGAGVAAGPRPIGPVGPTYQSGGTSQGGGSANQSRTARRRRRASSTASTRGRARPGPGRAPTGRARRGGPAHASPAASTPAARAIAA